MISQQSPQQIHVTSGQQIQAMQAQVNLQTGTVVMQPQHVTSSTGGNNTLSTPQVQVVSSLAQQQQRNIQAAVQKQVQQQQLQQNGKAAGATASPNKPTTQVIFKLLIIKILMFSMNLEIKRSLISWLVFIYYMKITKKRDKKYFSV